MPRFGADGVLKPAEIQAVADYVWTTFYGHPGDRRTSSAGAKIFADNCVACHGEQGQGNREVGAPRLASQVHLYGDTRETIVQPGHSAAPGRDAELGREARPGDDQGGDAVRPRPGRRRVRTHLVSRISKDRAPPATAAGGRGRPPLCQPCAGLPEDSAWRGPQDQMGHPGDLPDDLLSAALAAGGTAVPGSRPRRCCWISRVSGFTSSIWNCGRRISGCSPAC